MYKAFWHLHCLVVLMATLFLRNVSGYWLLLSYKTSRTRQTCLVSDKLHKIKPKYIIGSTRSYHYSTCSSNKTTIKASTTNDNDSDSNTKDFRKSYTLQGYTMPKNKSGVIADTNTGHTLMTDLPKKMGGQDTAPQPIETLLASWMGCTQATAIFVGRNMPNRIVIDKLEFNIEAWRDDRGAISLPLDKEPPIESRLQEISGTIQVYAKGTLTTQEVERLRVETEKRCPIANMILASGCKMNVDWIDSSTMVDG